MARTTLNLDEEVLRELKHRGKREKKPLGTIASELLAQAIAADPAGRPEFVWTAHPMGKARIDLADKDAVWAVLDQR